MDTDPRFDDDQVREILAAAADRHAEAERRALASPGKTSLTDLKEMAAEAGIDPAYVESAASDVMRLDHARSGRALGSIGPTQIENHALVVERVIPATVSEHEWADIVETLRETFGVSGIPGRFGDVREWISTNASDGSMPVRLRLEPTEAGTIVRIRQSIKVFRDLMVPLPATLATFGGGFLVAGLVTGNSVPFFPFALILAIIAVAFLLVGGVIRGTWVPKQQTKFDHVIDRIDLIARSGPEPKELTAGDEATS